MVRDAVYVIAGIFRICKAPDLDLATPALQSRRFNPRGSAVVLFDKISCATCFLNNAHQLIASSNLEGRRS